MKITNQAYVFHRIAMRMMDLARDEFKAGENEKANHFLRRAFESEKAAANHLREKFDKEPTRSILHRSAATIAHNLGLDTEAIQLLEEARMEGSNVPTVINQELEDVLVELFRAR